MANYCLKNYLHYQGLPGKMPYDPIKRSEDVARVFSKDDLRKYYRFRPARFYGGIATSDCIGCPLQCIFCWAWEQLIRGESIGQFYSPREVAGNILGIARKKGFKKVRISGNEPTISRQHLLKVMELIPENYLFILETNGILIGNDISYAEDLARFKNLYVRVSLKGTTENEFSILTGAEPWGFELQLKALANLLEAGVKVNPAVMVSFSPIERILSLQRRLKEIHTDFAEFEVEELVLYGDVEERLKRSNISPRTFYRPDKIPSEQI